MTEPTSQDPGLQARAPAPATVPLTKPTPKEGWTELGKTAVTALLLALLIRSFLYEPFNIPSGSMMPTLLVGDYLFVDKRVYGYSRYSFPFGLIPIADRIWAGSPPQRGDVIVFKLPSDNQTDYIKRIIGMPGDTVQTINGRLHINGAMVPRDPVGYERVENGMGQTITVTRYLETLPGGVVHSIYEKSDTEELDNAGPYTVPSGHYFAMGDNRDNSRDSRVMELVGFIPWRNIVGRADVIFFSNDGSAQLYEPWKWPWAIRYDRLFTLVSPTHLNEEGK